MRDPMTLMQGAPAAPQDQVTLANWRESGFGRWSFSHMRQLLPTASFAPAAAPAQIASAIQDLSALAVPNDTHPDLTLGQFLAHSQTDA